MVSPFMLEMNFRMSYMLNSYIYTQLCFKYNIYTLEAYIDIVLDACCSSYISGLSIYIAPTSIASIRAYRGNQPITKRPCPQPTASAGLFSSLFKLRFASGSSSA